MYKAIVVGGKEVALKIPKTDDIMATMDTEVIEKFRSEAEIWKRLEHSNIVTLLSGKTEPIPHMTMELMTGGNLKQLMKNHTLTVGETVHIMEQVLKGLSFAHRMASVHRDLKPENILFTADGVAKITDWGIGKFMASVGKSQSVGIKGTLDYCAPEQYDRREYGKVDWQTDIFQVGAMFYELLTGTNPFEGEDFADCMGKVLRYSPEPPSSINSDVLKELDEIVMGAIEKKKEDRWDSGAVMLNELKRAIRGRVIQEAKCSECGNVIDSSNRKLRCKDCKKYFCETCEGWIDKVDQYKGYEVKTGFPLCEDCYETSYQKQLKNIGRSIREQKEQKLEREEQERRLMEEERKRKIMSSPQYLWDHSLKVEEVLSEVQSLKEGLFRKKYEYERTKKSVEIRTNYIGMKFVSISGRNYYMGKYTVTQKEWKLVMGTTPWKGKRKVKEGDDYPATYISGDDCQEFVKKLNVKEGKNKYRVPTDDEWEHACRAGSTTKYCFGDDKRRLGEYAWYYKNAWYVGEKYAHRVGQKKPNQWGLYDMHGNVWEWISAAKGLLRVYRGGSWDLAAVYCGSAIRSSWLTLDKRNYNIGIRLVRSSD